MPSLSNIRDYGLAVGLPAVGGILNRRAAGSATNALTQGATTAMGTINAGADRARKTMADIYGEQKSMLNPYAAAGGPALDALKTGTAPGGDFIKPFDANTFDLYKDPGFQFRVKQGERAINQGANAGGIRFSGATLKALSNYNQEAASQEYTAARGRAVDDQTRAYTRTMDQANMGLDATGQEVNAAGTYGANLSNLETGTAKSLADLQTDLASAQAAGDIAKASSISDAINGIVSGVENVGYGRSLADIAKKIGVPGTPSGTPPYTPPYTPPNGAWDGIPVPGGSQRLKDMAFGSAGLIGAHAAGITGAGALGVLPSAAPLGGAGFGTAATGATTASGAGAGGLGSAAVGLLTNPVTIAAAAAIGVGLLWRRSQAHRTADDWVHGTQRDFDAQMAQINENPQLDSANKKELQQAAVTDYLASAIAFTQKHGGKGREVIGNAMRTFAKWYPTFASQAVA